MSKTNRAEDSADEILNESVETTVENTVETAAENTAETKADNQADTKRYTLTRFLQIKKQKKGVEVLLKLNYGKEIHTISEWEKLVEKVLSEQM